MVKRLVLCFSAVAIVFSSAASVASAQVASSPEVPKGKYVALGDSVAAGAGLPSSANPGDQQCQRSGQAYAYSVAEKANLNLVHAACGGAITDDLYTSQQVGNASIRAQLEAAFADGKPQLITITVGANDIRWSDFLKLCLSNENCDSRWYGYTVNGLLSVQAARLAYALYNIEKLSNGTPPRVVITGYYNPVSQACPAVIPSLTSGEVNWISSQIGKINWSLQTMASSYWFAKFAPVNFAGHDVCSTSSWIQGANSPAPFHPTAAGQAAIANSVIQKL